MKFEDKRTLVMQALAAALLSAAENRPDSEIEIKRLRSANGELCFSCSIPANVNGEFIAITVTAGTQ